MEVPLDLDAKKNKLYVSFYYNVVKRLGYTRTAASFCIDPRLYESQYFSTILLLPENATTEPRAHKQFYMTYPFRFA